MLFGLGVQVLSMIKGKSPEQLKEMFHLTQGFTEEERRIITEENKLDPHLAEDS